MLIVVRVRLDFAYDGRAYSGWAKQPGLITVQEELESGLAQFLRVPISLTVAGRTDAGVHARGQVAHFDIPVQVWESLLPKRIGDNRCQETVIKDKLSAILGPAFTIKKVKIAPEGFDARFSAGSRRYVFRIDDGAAPDPLSRGFVLRHRTLLNVDEMDIASRKLVGLHDFAAFCKQREACHHHPAVNQFRLAPPENRHGSRVSGGNDKSRCLLPQHGAGISGFDSQSRGGARVGRLAIPGTTQRATRKCRRHRATAWPHP